MILNLELSFILTNLKYFICPITENMQLLLANIVVDFYRDRSIIIYVYLLSSYYFNHNHQRKVVWFEQITALRFKYVRTRYVSSTSLLSRLIKCPKDGVRKKTAWFFAARPRSNWIRNEVDEIPKQKSPWWNLKFISSGCAKGCVARASVIFFCRPGERIIALLHKPRPAWTSCPGRCHWPSSSKKSVSCCFVSRSIIIDSINSKVDFRK